MRDLTIDVVMDDAPLFRYEANHVPKIGDTLTSIFCSVKGHYIVIGVDHLIAPSIPKYNDDYCSLVTLDVRLSED